jgi:4-hydroxy-4-methyl-2-oxoglutarate aldolase
MLSQEQAVAELQARWDKIRVANIYDTLDRMGYPNQCLDLGIKPLFPHRHLAGRVLTVRGSAYPVRRGEEGSDWASDYFDQLRKMLYPGCAVVVESGGEMYAGKFGEMTSWALQQGGARGIVLDSCIRDWLGLEVIPNFTACARATSPIESSQRWRIDAVNGTIGMPGTLTCRVRVDPGDWIIAEADGVIVVPQSIAMEALVAVEAMEAQEQGMREDMAAGMSFDDSYKKWGRA